MLCVKDSNPTTSKNNDLRKYRRFFGTCIWADFVSTGWLGAFVGLGAIVTVTGVVAFTKV